jgi:hypothetical protein
MTTVGPAQRLLAELMESEPLSAEPIAEVCADLAALGIDPQDAIAVTRRLVEGMDSPAATLLGRIEESERIDADSRALLSADIAAVYGQTDEGVARSTIENAKRMAQSDGKVVPMRRGRLRILYIVGALAACLALFILGELYKSSAPMVANDPTVVALLVVDPGLAPPSLREARLPAGDLAQRLAEARARAEGLSVVALLSVREPNGVVSDSAILAGFALRGAAPVGAQELQQGPTAIALQKIAGPLPADLVVIDLPAK